MRLNNKVAIVTGGGVGIGIAVARCLAKVDVTHTSTETSPQEWQKGFWGKLHC